MSQKRPSIQTLCLIGLFTAVMSVMAQLSIPMPFGVPITMQSFGVALAGILLGARKGFFTTCIYLFLGGAGLPVFSNFTGGLQCLVGPTGGFLLSFPLMAWIIGFGCEYRLRHKGLFIAALIAGNALNLLCGAGLFCRYSGVTLSASLTSTVLPFIPVTVLKMIAVAPLGLRLRKHLTALIHNP